MSARRASIRNGALFAALIAFGLALGFGWQQLQSRPNAGRTVDVSWLTGALNAVRTVVVPDAPVAAQPPFALRGTMVAADPASSTAIFDLGKGRVFSLHPGDTLQGVGRLLEIADKGVYFDVNGRRKLFTFNDSTLAPAEASTQAQLRSPVHVSLSGGTPGMIAQADAAPASNRFVVPADASRISDAPADEPELNATPRPGQSIDITVWN
jgi:hypothetical protein